MADVEEVADAGAPRDRQVYLSQAYINAFGAFDEPDWDPEQGFAANRDRIVKLYDYWDTYLRRPDQFLWAGLGRLAGGAVVGGLDLLVRGGETFLTKTMVRIGKAIFHDLAWQHEAFLDDPQLAIDLATAQDATLPLAEIMRTLGGTSPRATVTELPTATRLCLKTSNLL